MNDTTVDTAAQIEARDEKKLLRLQKQLASYELLIDDARARLAACLL